MSNWVISVNIKQLVLKKKEKKKKTIQEILPSSIKRQSENLGLKNGTFSVVLTAHI